MFLVTGLLPYFLFQHLAMRLMDGIDANRGLFAYRQVKPFDTLMSRAVVELLMNLLVYTVTLGLLGWLGLPRHAGGPAGGARCRTLLLFLLGTGFGMFAAVVSHDRPRVRSFIRISMLPLYFVSGVIFPVARAAARAPALAAAQPAAAPDRAVAPCLHSDYPPLDGVNLRYPLLLHSGAVRAGACCSTASIGCGWSPAPEPRRR